MMQLFLFLLLVLLLHDRWVKSNAKYQGKKNINKKEKEKKLNIRLAYLEPMLELESRSNESKSMIVTARMTTSVVKQACIE
jgi:hypothetical protein